MTRRRLVSVLSVTLVIAGFLGWLVFYSSALGLDNVEVRGEQTLSAATVEEVLALQRGTPLARVDLAAAEAALENITQIESASVTRDWPGTLVVRLTERSPVAAVELDGTTWLLDRFGVLFAQVSAVPAGVISLRVDQPGPDDRATAAGLQVIGALAPAIREIVIGISAPSLTEIQLDLIDGRTVIWGGPEDSVRKSQILAGLLAGGVVGTVYDVSSPTSAVVR